MSKKYLQRLSSQVSHGSNDSNSHANIKEQQKRDREQILLNLNSPKHSNFQSLSKFNQESKLLNFKIHSKKLLYSVLNSYESNKFFGIFD